MNEDQISPILRSGDPVTSGVRPYSTRARNTEVRRQGNQLSSSRLPLGAEGHSTQEWTSGVREVSSFPCNDDVINPRNAWREELIGCYLGACNGVVNGCHATSAARDKEILTP